MKRPNKDQFRLGALLSLKANKRVFGRNATDLCSRGDLFLILDMEWDYDFCILTCAATGNESEWNISGLREAFKIVKY